MAVVNVWHDHAIVKPMYHRTCVILNPSSTDWQETTMVIQYAGNYHLSIEAQRSLPLDQIQCLLGDMGFGRRECPEAPLKYEFMVSVIRNGQEVQVLTGIDNPSFSHSTTIEKIVARGVLSKGDQISAKIRLLEDWNSLALAKPNFGVQRWVPYEFFGWYIFVGVAISALLLLSLVAWFGEVMFPNKP